ncbi:MAG: hypothetical protein VX796_05990 [Pseudomonadota bacterium]|nr:hypothetical protein [Pseudomonadota bacterium]
MSDQWNGPCDGLPPVGQKVEFITGERGTVIASAEVDSRGARAWVQMEDLSQRIPSVAVLSPIRSAEEVAVEEMESVFSTANDGTFHSGLTAIYAAIRDGKIPGVKLED